MIAAIALAAASGFCVPNPNASAPPATVVDAYIAAHNLHDIAGIRKTITANAEMGRSGSLSTGAEVLRRYEEIVFKRFPDVHTEQFDRITAGDLVAQLEKITGISAEGETGLAVYRVNQGCIVQMSISQ